MKKTLVIAAAVALVACAQPEKPGGQLTVGEGKNEKTSYSIGYDLGTRLPQVLPQLSELDKDMLMQGIRDAVDNNPQLTTEEIQKLVTENRNEVSAKRQKEMDEARNKNVEEGIAFLADNKTKPGVRETASGLQYKIVKQGTGKKPKATDQVQVHYQGTLIDGTEFDSSYKRGEPITFPLNGVIKGWTEGLQLLNEGGEMMLYIPSDLAYGPRGAGGQIGPNATLIFKVELLKVNP